MMDDNLARDVVLVVDDSPDALRLLTDALDAAGMTVMVALDGAAALRICERVLPDIVLLDAVMPGMDGFEVCRRMKAERRLAHIPVVFMTGLSETEHVVLGFEAGGVDYVAKPIVIAQMLARIKTHLANARLTQSARNALDVSGRHLFAVDRAGAVLWATPQAMMLLGNNGLALPACCVDWLVKAASQKRDADRRATPPRVLEGDLRLQFLGALKADEYLLRVARTSSAESQIEFGQDLGLTRREGEVLSWLSKGKSNRDIAEILGLSPRTIDKHLEQIYAKLGVENRSAATAIAVQRTRENDSV